MSSATFSTSTPVWVRHVDGFCPPYMVATGSSLFVVEPEGVLVRMEEIFGAHGSRRVQERARTPRDTFGHGIGHHTLGFDVMESRGAQFLHAQGGRLFWVSTERYSRDTSLLHSCSAHLGGLSFLDVARRTVDGMDASGGITGCHESLFMLKSMKSVGGANTLLELDLQGNLLRSLVIPGQAYPAGRSVCNMSLSSVHMSSSNSMLLLHVKGPRRHAGVTHAVDVLTVNGSHLVRRAQYSISASQDPQVTPCVSVSRGARLVLASLTRRKHDGESIGAAMDTKYSEYLRDWHIGTLHVWDL